LTADDTKTRLATSRVLLIAIVAIAGLLAVSSSIMFQAPALIGAEKILTDFDAFYVAGTMTADGHAADTYEAAKTFAAQKKMTGDMSFMPWTYPPPYTALAGGLAFLPVGLSYFLFVSATLALYLWVLRRIAGRYLPGVLVAILPTLLLTVRTGQNGFLMGALVGLFLLAFIDKRRAAGLPLGLMVLKPHLAVGISLVALLGRRWHAMALATGVVATALLLSTLALGTRIWPAFLGGVREASDFLALGYYPLFRMTSIYASLRSFGISASLALTIHALGALAALACLVHAWRRERNPRALAATVCATSMFISPYSYDYDLAIFGVGIAFVLPEIVKRSANWELLGLLSLSWFATGYGLLWVVFFGDPSTGQYIGLWALGSPALIVLVGASSFVLRRGDSGTEGSGLEMASATPDAAPSRS
jgi:hypothetical protein